MSTGIIVLIALMSLAIVIWLLIENLTKKVKKEKQQQESVSQSMSMEVSSEKLEESISSLKSTLRAGVKHLEGKQAELLAQQKELRAQNNYQASVIESLNLRLTDESRQTRETVLKLIEYNTVLFEELNKTQRKLAALAPDTLAIEADPDLKKVLAELRPHPPFTTDPSKIASPTQGKTGNGKPNGTYASAVIEGEKANSFPSRPKSSAGLPKPPSLGSRGVTKKPARFCTRETPATPVPAVSLGHNSPGSEQNTKATEELPSLESMLDAVDAERLHAQLNQEEKGSTSGLHKLVSDPGSGLLNIRPLQKAAAKADKAAAAKTATVEEEASAEEDKAPVRHETGLDWNFMNLGDEEEESDSKDNLFAGVFTKKDT